MPTSEEFRDVLRAAISGRPISRAAVEAGLPRDAIRNILQGHDPKLSRVEDLAKALGLEFYIGPPREAQPEPADHFTAAVVAAIHDEVVSALTAETRALHEKLVANLAALPRLAPPANDLEDPGALGVQATADSATGAPGTRSVQMIEMEAAAGGGAYNLDDAPVRGPVWFRRDWIDSRGIDPTQAVVISVQGDSMEPTLPAGCKILVDRQRQRRRVGKIYVITTSDGLVVKRLGRGEGGGWLLVSDNDAPEWPDVPWPDDAVVAGEVKWMARELP